jgi:hypothetical protein
MAGLVTQGEGAARAEGAHAAGGGDERAGHAQGLQLVDGQALACSLTARVLKVR